MAELTFLGATGTVTGSRFLLNTDRHKLLVDCGMFQGRKENRLRNWQEFPINPSEIDKVLLTHAHIDHSGYLPRLYKNGFAGQVHCTHATHELCQIMLKDSAHIQEEDAEWANKKGYSKHSPALPLYTSKDAFNVLEHFKPVFYGEENYLENSHIRVKFKDAGHILGSSFIEFKNEYGPATRKILFSGDFGRPAQTILKDPTQVFNVDYLILESTYGDRLHEESDPVSELKRVINASFQRGGVLVIPSFAVGRTQTLLYLIRQLELSGEIPVMDVFIDSPMAINVVEVFDKHSADFNLTTRVNVIQDRHIFQPQKLKICRSRQKSIALNQIESNAIIISASGMATAGRILHHLKQRLPDSKNTVLFIGYQAEGTRGRTILEGHPTVKIHGMQVPVKASVENIPGFSGHGDYNEIMAWLMGFNKPPEHVFIVHGEPESSEFLADKIRTRFGWQVTVPKFMQKFDLDF